MLDKSDFVFLYDAPSIYDGDENIAALKKTTGTEYCVYSLFAQNVCLNQSYNKLNLANMRGCNSLKLKNVYELYAPNLQYATEGYDVPLGKDMGIKSMLESIHNQLDDLTTKIKDRISKGEFPDVRYTCILREGVPEEEILHYARTEKPLIIIMGTRGMDEKELDLIGSVTAEII